jgi:hypothetical protein
LNQNFSSTKRKQENPNMLALSSLGYGMMGGSQMMVRPASAEDARALNIGGSDLIKLALVPGDVRTIEEIDTYMPGYRRFPFRADELAPVVLVDASIAEYRLYTLASVFRQVRSETSLQAPVAEVDPETTLDTYRCRPYALGAFIPAFTRAQQKFFDPERLAARRIADALGLGREIRVWTLATTLTNWNAANRTTLDAAHRWNGGASGDPLLDIQTGIEAASQPVTDIYLGQKAAHAMLRHAKMSDFITSMLGGGPRPSSMIEATGTVGTQATLDFTIPGLPPFHVVTSRMLNDTTGAIDEIIGGDVVLVCNPPGQAQFEDIRTFNTFRVRGPSGTGFVSRSFEVPARGRDGGTMLVSGYDDAEVMVSDTAGYLIKDAVQ